MSATTLEIDNVVEVVGVSKVYRLFDTPRARFREALSITGKRYSSDFFALNNVSFDVKRGETLGLIGENGAGKSTLLKIIAGVLKPTSGLVKVSGRVSALLELGTGFNPELTGTENIYFYGLINGISRKEMEARVSKIVEFSELKDFINQPLKTYSSGMFARLAFSAAVHIEPEILIIDEALSVGDVFFQMKCNKYMKDNMSDCTKIIVTHDLGTISKMTDRAIVIDEGRVGINSNPINAIEYFTKIGHKKHKNLVDNDAGELDNDEQNGSLDDKKSSKFLSNDLISIDSSSLSGALKIFFSRFSIRVNELDYVGYVSPGDKVDVFIEVSSREPQFELIYGYLLKDKHGLAICGDNSVSLSDNLLTSFDPSSSNRGVKLSFVWPEIQEDEYFLTLGIGSGGDSHEHVIQCWAHNIFLFNGKLNGNSVHGMFNNPISSLERVSLG